MHSNVQTGLDALNQTRTSNPPLLSPVDSCPSSSAFEFRCVLYSIHRTNIVHQTHVVLFQKEISRCIWKGWNETTGIWAQRRQSGWLTPKTSTWDQGLQMNIHNLLSVVLGWGLKSPVSLPSSHCDWKHQIHPQLRCLRRPVTSTLLMHGIWPDQLSWNQEPVLLPWQDKLTPHSISGYFLSASMTSSTRLTCSPKAMEVRNLQKACNSPRNLRIQPSQIHGYWPLARRISCWSKGTSRDRMRGDDDNHEQCQKY